MSKEEFLAWVQANYKAWAGDTKRPLASWLVSLEEFAVRQYEAQKRKSPVMREF